MTNPFMAQAPGQSAQPTAQQNTNPFSAMAGGQPQAPVPVVPTAFAHDPAQAAGYPGQQQAAPPAYFDGRQAGHDPMAAVQQQPPQGFAPAPSATPPAYFGGQPPVQQQAQNSPPWGQQQAPAAAPWAAPGQGGDAFSAPSSGGAGPRPALRDLEGRLVLIRVVERNVMRDVYQAKPTDPQEPTNTCDLAVLDGGPVIMSPKVNEPQSVPTKWGDAPCTIDGMIIRNKGVMSRTKAPLTLGRIAKAPLPALTKRADWPNAPEGTPDHVVLAYWIQQAPSREFEFKTQMFWTVVNFTEQDAQVARDWLAANPSFLQG